MADSVYLIILVMTRDHGLAPGDLLPMLSCLRDCLQISGNTEQLRQASGGPTA